MWYRKVEIVNVGPFKHLAVDLTRGLVGLFGVNGSGKSTFLNLLYALPTNDYRRFEGVKMDCVNNTAGEDEESYVAGEIVHNDHVLAIRHRFRPKAKVELIVDDDRPITDANKARERIEEVLGIDSDMIDLYVFKEQDKVYDFLTRTPTETAKSYQTLCRTQLCGEVYDYIGTFLSKDADVNAQLVDNSDDLARDVEDLRSRKREIKTSLDEQEKMLLNAKSLESARRIVERRRRWETLREQQGKEKARRKELREKLDASEAELAEAASALDRVEKRLEEAGESAERAKVALRGWDQYLTRKRQRRKLRDEAEELKTEKDKTKVPEEPEGYGDSDPRKLHAQVVRLKDRLAAAEKTLELLKQEGVVECPTCGTKVDSLKNVIAEAEATRKTAPAQIRELEDRKERYYQYEVSLREYERWEAGYAQRVAANKKALDSLEELKQPAGDREELAEAVNEYEKLLAKVKKTREAHRQVSELRARHSATLESCQTRVNELAAQIEQNVEPDDRVEQVERRLAEHAVAEKAIAALEGEAKGVERQLDDKRDQLEELRRRLRKSKRVRRQAQIAASVRELCHPSGLPKVVARANLRRMEGAINEGLGQFGDPFWVETDDNLSFVVHKPGEPPQPARRLSTGQRVVLALSFWPAVASLWSQDLGMLALDEPTANLDEDNRRFLAEALGRMTARVRGRRQLLMVSHDQSLRPAFDQVIDLGAKP